MCSCSAACLFPSCLSRMVSFSMFDIGDPPVTFYWLTKVAFLWNNTEPSKPLFWRPLFFYLNPRRTFLYTFAHAGCLGKPSRPTFQCGLRLAWAGLRQATGRCRILAYSHLVGNMILFLWFSPMVIPCKGTSDQPKCLRSGSCRTCVLLQ